LRSADFSNWRLRTAIFGHRLRTPEEPDFHLFRDILADASATSRQWGATVTLVYLPSYSHFLLGREKDHPMLAEMHRRVLEIAAAQHISTIDIEKAFFAVQDPRTLFFYPGSHYNEVGYLLVGETIVNALGEMDKQQRVTAASGLPNADTASAPAAGPTQISRIEQR
jgi:hypothetical protein